MNIKNVTNSIKTTILGLILIIAGLFYTYFKEAPDYVILSIFLVSGISFMFFPDEFLNKLKTFLNKKTNEF